MPYFYRRYFFVLGDERRIIIEPKSPIVRLHCGSCGLTFAAAVGWLVHCPFDGTALNTESQLAAVRQKSAHV